MCIPADVNDAGQCSITRKGVYTYQDKASECTGTVNIGCATPNKITIDTRCPNQRRAVASTHTEKGRGWISSRHMYTCLCVSVINCNSLFYKSDSTKMIAIIELLVFRFKFYFLNTGFISATQKYICIKKKLYLIIYLLTF